MGFVISYSNIPHAQNATAKYATCDANVKCEKCCDAEYLET